MNRLCTALAATLLSVVPTTAEKFDAHTSFVLTPHLAESRSAQQPVFGAIVSFRGDADTDALENAGVTASSVAGSTAVVRGTAAQLRALADMECVRSVSVTRELRPSNDLAADGAGLSDLPSLEQSEGRAFTGKGVIVGLFDNGFDFGNPAFRADGHSRVKRFWHYTDENGTCTEYAVPAIIDALVTDDADAMHGSHVLGTMAGAHPSEQYNGVAREADIAVAAGPLYNTNIADGVARIARYAAEEGRPCVINLSISDFLGPRDGSDAFAEALSEATVAAGDAILVISAGNYHTGKYSLSRTLEADDPALRSFVGLGFEDSSGAVAVWSGDRRSFALNLVFMNTMTGEVLARYPVETDDDKVLMLGSDDLTGYDEYDYTVDPAMSVAFNNAFVAAFYRSNRETNNRPCYYVDFNVWRDRVNNYNGRITMGIEAIGEAGQRLDMVMDSQTAELRSLWIKGWQEGGGDLSISSMACARGAVSVGAWVTRNYWRTLTDGRVFDLTADHTIGDIAPWSSRGVLADGSSRPVVAAPGAALFSVLSTPYRDANPDGRQPVAQIVGNDRTDYWTWEYGTSMSSPEVAGAIALWLEADPDLSAHEVLDIIRKTSKADSYTAASPVAFGAGKFDAVAGLREVLARRAGLAGPSALPEASLVVRRDGSVLEAELVGRESFDARLLDLAGRTLCTARAVGGIARFDAPLPNGVYLVEALGQCRKVAF